MDFAFWTCDIKHSSPKMVLEGFKFESDLLDSVPL